MSADPLGRQLQYSDLLQTFAEVAVAFAGFASLLGLFGRSPEAVQKVRLIGMVRAALIATAFSLIPFVPFALGAAEVTAWRIAAGLFLLVSGTNSFLVWRQVYQMWKRGEFEFRVGYFTIPMGAVHLALAGAACVSTEAEHSAGLYLASVAEDASDDGDDLEEILNNLEQDREHSFEWDLRLPDDQDQAHERWNREVGVRQPQHRHDPHQAHGHGQVDDDR